MTCKGRPAIEALNARGVPSGEILALEAALTAPQVRHRGAVRTVQADGIGELKLFTLPAKFDRTPGDVTCAPPRLGAHTMEILEGIGYSRERIAELRSQGVV